MATGTITGNLTADAELRFTPSGDAVVSFTVADTERMKKGEQWEDGDTTFWRISAWGKRFEDLAEHLTKGARVVVQAKGIKVRPWEDKDGNKRLSPEGKAETIGLIPRTGARGNATPASDGTWTPAQEPVADPWGTPTAANTGWGTTNNAPF